MRKPTAGPAGTAPAASVNSGSPAPANPDATPAATPSNPACTAGSTVSRSARLAPIRPPVSDPVTSCPPIVTCGTAAAGVLGASTAVWITRGPDAARSGSVTPCATASMSPLACRRNRAPVRFDTTCTCWSRASSSPAVLTPRACAAMIWSDSAPTLRSAALAAPTSATIPSCAACRASEMALPSAFTPRASPSAAVMT